MNQGKLLARLRSGHGYTQMQMARKMGISKSYYCMLEKGSRTISKNIALKLNRQFGVPFDIMFQTNQDQ